MKSRLFLLALGAMVAGITPVAMAQASLEGSGEKSTIDCGGADAHVIGSSNHVRVTGDCTLLTVEGSGNVVIAQMAAKSTISVVGTSNAVTWQAPGQSRPKTSSTGVGNSIARAK